MSETPGGIPGEYGAVVMRTFPLLKGSWRQGEYLAPGTVIPAEVVQSWPIPNRFAIGKAGLVRFFLTRREAEEARKVEPPPGTGEAPEPPMSNIILPAVRLTPGRPAGSI